MKTLDLFFSIAMGLISVIALICTFLLKRYDLLAIVFVTGLLSVILFSEYQKLKKQENVQ
jgi:hypothetical protein